jgi:uncharacterized BrkB/YihY/UPF0761 family membrane protein
VGVVRGYEGDVRTVSVPAHKTWGTPGAVIVTLIWLRLAGLSLLFSGELNAEAAP